MVYIIVHVHPRRNNHARTQEGLLGQADAPDPPQTASPSPPNVLVLGDLRRILPRSASDSGEREGGGGGGGGGRGGVGGGERERWDLRAPNVVGAVIDAPPEVRRRGGGGVVVHRQEYYK